MKSDRVDGLRGVELAFSRKGLEVEAERGSRQMTYANRGNVGYLYLEGGGYARKMVRFEADQPDPVSSLLAKNPNLNAHFIFDPLIIETMRTFANVDHQPMHQVTRLDLASLYQIHPRYLVAWATPIRALRSDART